MDPKERPREPGQWKPTVEFHYREDAIGLLGANTQTGMQARRWNRGVGRVGYSRFWLVWGHETGPDGPTELAGFRFPAWEL